MDLITIILLAIGLAMDCFAVSIANGATLDRFHFGKFFSMAFLFGLFQGVMPLIGYLLGYKFIDYISAYDHWISLIILSFIGIKMIKEDIWPDKDDNGEEKKGNNYAPVRLLILSIATSIDALATGLIFLSEPDSIWIGVGVIALVSFLFSFGGSCLGLFFGKKIKMKFGIVGGIILIAIGVKILVEHTCL